MLVFVFFSSRRRHTRCALVTGVQTCALPICRLSGSDPLPSCRRLAHSLGVSRNTVVLAYQALTDEGLLISRERIGYFVNTEMVFQQAGTQPAFAEQEGAPEIGRAHV